MATLGLVVGQAFGVGLAGPSGASPSQPRRALDPLAVVEEVSPRVAANPERHVSPVAQSALQGTPDVAFDGVNHLVVWAEARGTTYSIVAARVDAAGTILDPNGIVLISDTNGERYNPAVAFAGDHYLVAWEDAFFGQGWFIGGIRVTTAGVPLGTVQFISEFGGPQERRPDIASDGTSSLVVWQRDGIDVLGARVDAGGNVVQQGIPVSDEPGNQSVPAVAFNGTSYMVVWQDDRSNAQGDLYAARVTTAGAITDPTGFAVTTAAGSDTAPDIDWGGGQHLLTWVNSASGTRVARVSSAAVVQDVGGVPLPSGSAAGFPAVAFNGSSHQVVWSDRRNGQNDVFGARVGTDGTVLDATARTLASAPGDEIWPAIAAGGGTMLAVWDDASAGATERDVLGGRVATGGTLVAGSTRVLATRVVSQTRPASSFDGTNNLVVWSDNRSGTGADVYAARMTNSGALLDPRGLRLSASAAGEFFPAAAFGAGTYLVVYQHDPSGGNNADIYGQLVAPSGAPAGATIVISAATNDQSEPTVVFDGTNFLVAWTDFRSGAGDIHATRVTPTGTVLGAAGFPVSTATGLQSAPEAAFDGTNSLVVWGDNRNATADIYGARVSPSAVLDPGGIGIQTSGAAQFRPSIAFGGSTYLVAWDEGGNIRGTRVTPAAAVSDPAGILLSSAPDQQDSPSVAFNGSFLVAWNDRRSGATYDIYGTEVATDGSVDSPSGDALSTGPTDELSATVARASSGWSVVYTHPLPGGTGVFRRGTK